MMVEINKDLFEECFGEKPTLDLQWMWDAVKQFNDIANPGGVNKSAQHKLVLEETQEFVLSKTKKDVLDGIIDSLVVLAPLVDRESFLLESIDSYSMNTIGQDVETYNYNGLVRTFLLCAYHFRGNIVGAIQEVLASNMSKFVEKLTPDETSDSNDIQIYKKQVEDYYMNVKKSPVEVEVVERNNYFVFVNKHTGKVLKGHDEYFDPNLERYI